MQQKYASSDDFGSFLLSLKQAASQPKSQRASMRIMRTLSREQEAPVVKMMSQVKVSWSDFTEGLKYLEETGLVEMDDDAEGGTLRLTEEGKHWVQTINADWDEEEEEEG